MEKASEMKLFPYGPKKQKSSQRPDDLRELSNTVTLFALKQTTDTVCLYYTGIHKNLQEGKNFIKPAKRKSDIRRLEIDKTQWIPPCAE